MYVRCDPWRFPSLPPPPLPASLHLFCDSGFTTTSCITTVSKIQAEYSIGHARTGFIFSCFRFRFRFLFFFGKIWLSHPCQSECFVREVRLRICDIITILFIIVLSFLALRLCYFLGPYPHSHVTAGESTFCCAKNNFDFVFSLSFFSFFFPPGCCLFFLLLSLTLLLL